MVGDACRWRLILFYGGLFFAVRIQQPFFPLWLSAKGLSQEAIDIVLAAPMVVRVWSVPAMSRLIDRWGIFAWRTRGLSTGTALGYTIVGPVEGFAAILAAVAVASIPVTLLVRSPKLTR
jgi:MFS transporter, PPP family, 3-phenylpropionic acid transporter